FTGVEDAVVVRVLKNVAADHTATRQGAVFERFDSQRGLTGVVCFPFVVGGEEREKTHAWTPFLTGVFGQGGGNPVTYQIGFRKVGSKAKWRKGRIWRIEGMFGT